MANQMKHDFVNVAEIVRDAGGRIVGRTRFQKIGCILELAGLGEGFQFYYKNFGPYSEALATATRDADILGFLTETEQKTQWGGWYSTFTTDMELDDTVPVERTELAKKAAAADSIVLELAVTAAFLASQGVDDAWEETERRKPEKVTEGRLEKAKVFYAVLKRIETPEPLPDI